MSSDAISCPPELSKAYSPLLQVPIPLSLAYPIGSKPKPSTSKARDEELLVYYWNSDKTAPENTIGRRRQFRLKIESERPHVVFIADTLNQKPLGLDDYVPTPLDRHSKGKSGGTFAYVRSDVDKDVKVKLYPEDRLIGVEFILSRLTVYGTYLPPTTEAVAANKEAIPRWIKRFHAHSHFGEKIIVMGDLNAKHPTWKSKAVKANDKLLRKLMQQTDMAPVDMSQEPPGNLDAHVTCSTKSGKGSFIDWALANRGEAWQGEEPEMQVLYVDRSGLHNPIQVSAPVKLTPSDPTLAPNQLRLKWKGGHYRRACFEIKRYAPLIEAAFDDIETRPGSKLVRAKAMLRYLQATIIALGAHLGDMSASLKLPGDARRRRGTTEGIEEAYDELMHLKLKYLELKNGLRDPDEEKELVKLIDDKEEAVIKLVARAQVQELEDKARAVESEGQKKEMKKFYSLVNEQKPEPVALKGPDGHVDLRTSAQAQTTTTYVKGLYQTGVKLPRKTEDECKKTLRESKPHSSDKPFTVDELLRALKSKKRSSAGADGIDTGFFLVCCREAPKPFLRFYNYLLANDVSPDELRVELLSQISKGKGGTTPDCMRTIGVVSIVWGTFSTMSSRRLGRIIEPRIAQEAGGSKENRGVCEQVLALAMAHRWSFIEKQLLITMTLDQSKAFDSVTPRKARTDLAAHVGTGLFHKLLTKFMTDRPAAVRWKGYAYLPFRATRGVPQGSAVSCMIPNVIMDPMVKGMKVKGFGVYVRGRLFCSLTYVDDIVLFAKSVDEAIAMYDEVVKWLGKLGMKLNGSKHEIMVSGLHPKDPRNIDAIRRLKVAFGTAKVHQATLRYLGAFFAPGDPTWKHHWKRRCGHAMGLALKTRYNGAFQNIPSPITQRLVFLSYLRPAALFCVEVGDITGECLRSLEAIQRIALSRAVAQNTFASGPLLNVIAGVQSMTSFIDEMKVKWWIQGVTGVIKERVFRGGKAKLMLRRKHQLKFRQGLVHTELTWCWDKLKGRFAVEFRKHTYFQPRYLMGSMTMRVLEVFHKVGVLQKVLKLLVPVKRRQRYDCFELWESLRKVLSDVEAWHDKQTEQKVLDESKAPCRFEVLTRLYEKRKAWREFKQKYPWKKEWLKDPANHSKPDGVYHEKAKYPRWACLFDELLPPQLYAKLKANGAYRVYWGLLMGIPHWHAILKGEEREGRCPYCRNEVEARGLHVLYECKELEAIRPPAAQNTEFDAKTRRIRTERGSRVRRVAADGGERHVTVEFKAIDEKSAHRIERHDKFDGLSNEDERLVTAMHDRASATADPSRGVAGGFYRRRDSPPSPNEGEEKSEPDGADAEVLPGWEARELLAFSEKVFARDRSLWVLKYEEGAPAAPKEIEQGPEGGRPTWDLSALEVDW